MSTGLAPSHVSAKGANAPGETKLAAIAFQTRRAVVLHRLGARGGRAARAGGCDSRHRTAEALRISAARADRGDMLPATPTVPPVLSVAVLALAAMHFAAVVVLTVRPRLRLVPTAMITTAAAGCGLLALGSSLAPGQLVVGPLVLAPAVYAMRRHDLHPVGAVLWASYLLMSLTALAGGAWFLTRLDVSAATAALLWASALIGLAAVPSLLVTTREGWEPLLRRTWRRPRAPLTEPARAPFPMVSVQVPCHAEPPEVVIATLETIAALDYPDFEVLVIDNNTADESLWRPVERACCRLGPRFRFLHVMGVQGAKAGALNWALPHTDPRAEVLAIVDADYQVDPQWLRRTIGHFADSRTGFVQSPHAYRNFTERTLGRWANAEYGVFFAAGMVSLNEHNAGLTVGTMSLIRRRALEEAGGWAEWCLTEDSELAIRIHAAGYDSVYLPQPYGRGLIPETFAGYRKQRFRWTYGPVQELKRHWRLFLPGRLGQPSALTLIQRLHHANHGLDVVFIGLRALMLPLGAAAATSMVVHDEQIRVPVELWAAATAVLLGQALLRLLTYRRLLGATLGQALAGTVAFAALHHVIVTASLRALLGGSASWQRTDKFRPSSRGLHVLSEARTETAIGTACLSAAAGLALTAPGQIVVMLAVGLAMQGAAYLASPVLALLADRDVQNNIDALTARPGPLATVSDGLSGTPTSAPAITRG